MRIRRLNHSRYQHEYHLVWGTKYRRQFLQEYVKTVFIACCFEIVKKYPELFIKTINTDKDHVHMQIEIPPNVAVSAVVQRIKMVTSIKLWNQFKFIQEMYLDSNIWAVGYFSSTIGLNEAQIQKYIEVQGLENTPQDASQEFS
jgi:putative transposase